MNFDDVRRRLEESKKDLTEESYSRGYEEGLAWAKEFADYEQLFRLHHLIASVECGDPDFDSYFEEDSGVWYQGASGPAEWLAAEILGPDFTVSEHYEWLWGPVFGEKQMIKATTDLERLRGFARGADKVFVVADV